MREGGVRRRGERGREEGRGRERRNNSCGIHKSKRKKGGRNKGEILWSLGYQGGTKTTNT